MMNNSVGFILLWVFVILVFISGSVISYGIGYKQGQIDLMNGNQVYCLTKQADSSFDWVECAGE
jgi:hypothetical protein